MIFARVLVAPVALGLFAAIAEVPSPIVSDPALEEYARGVAGGEKNLYFDVSNGVFAAPPDAWPQMAKRLRQIGVDHFLFGTDSPILQGHTLKEMWPILRERLPLTDAEFTTIASNVLPFAQPRR